jgi:hypothetical protein
MTKTACLEKTIWQPRLAKWPKPMRVWGKEGITCPCIATGGRDGAEASIALATDRTGRPFVMQTPTEGAVGLRFATGALDAKYMPLAPESAMPVWEVGRLVGLQLEGVNKAK